MSLPAGAHDLRRCGGGDINEGWHATLSDGADAFVKTRAGAVPGEYALEAAGLEWLGEPGALRVPRVLEVGEDYLALEWIEPGALDMDGAEELGRGLAATHAAGAPHFGAPHFGAPHFGAPHFGTPRFDAPLSGASEPTRFGSLQLPNDPTPDWASFFVERRLRPLAALAADQGWLTSAGARALERICGHIVELAGPVEPPARLHGDLWGGNVLADTQSRPWLIDPAVYGGHREVDLAMLRLFGAPSERVFAAYEELAPLADGWHQRVELWQLPPMLVHGVLFGGSYRGAAERIALRYAG
jgi:fructosamine-3-kinase